MYNNAQEQKTFCLYFRNKENVSCSGQQPPSIIKKQDGYVSEESEVGVGTIFHIYLPASQIEIQKRLALSETEVENTEEVSIMHEGKILLMDDEAIISLNAAQELRNLNYEAEAVGGCFVAIGIVNILVQQALVMQIFG